MSRTDRRRETRDTPLAPLILLVTVAALIGWWIGNALNEGGQHFLLRASAAVSAILFTVGFLTLRRNEPARRRPVWIALGTNHAFHFGAIVAFQLASWSPDLSASALVVGGLAYVMIGAATILRLSGPVLLRCSWYVWFVFAITYLTRAIDRPLTSGLGFVALLGVAVARIVIGRRQIRSSRDCAPARLST